MIAEITCVLPRTQELFENLTTANQKTLIELLVNGTNDMNTDRIIFKNVSNYITNTKRLR